jgi:YD repeat-containing protein
MSYIRMLAAIFMQRFVFILIVVILGSCNQTNLQIDALDFGDIEEDARRSFHVDTTYIVSQTAFADIDKFDTIGRITFDPKGKILLDGTNPFSTYKYEYDSNGLVKKIRHRDFDVYLDYVPNYTFISDSLLLRQSWTGDADYVSSYLFYPTGKLREEVNVVREYDIIDDLIQHRIKPRIKSINETRETPTVFRNRYNDTGLLEVKEDWLVQNGLEKLKSRTIYFYGESDKTIDSTITDFPDFNYRTRTYYDARGLKEKRIYNDTLMIGFLHTTGE